MLVKSAEQYLQHQLKLRFYDLNVVIESDTCTFTDLFAKMYARFLVEDLAGKCDNDAVFTIYTKPENPYGVPAVVIQGEVTLIEDPCYLEGLAYENIYYTVLKQIKSHFLIHAGAVSYNNTGLILAADSMHGKTTTVLELVRRRFKYLSDEIAAIGRGDRLLHPFPRSLRIRPDTLQRVGLNGAARGAEVWADKLLLDIEAIRPGSLGQAAPLKWVILFSGPEQVFSLDRDRSERELHLFVDRASEALLAGVRQVADLAGTATNPENTCTRLSLRTKDRAAALAQVESLCRSEGIILYDVLKKIEKPTSFDSPARLEAVPHTQAVIELMRGFMGSHQSALLQAEFGGNPRRMFLELAGLIRDAQCFRLSVGPLEQMADLICGLVGAD